MFKVAICDDDEIYRKNIKEMVIKYSEDVGDMVFYEYSSGEELLEDVYQMHNLLFLDIQMLKKDGNETAKEFRDMNKDAVLVFCTNYQKPTTESFKVRPYRYIMKDINDQMLKEEMPDIIYEMMNHTKVEYLDITDDGKMYRIPINQILYISVVKRGSVIHQYSCTTDKEINCHESVKEIYAKLSELGFEYAHNSYIVNLANIIRVSKNILTLKDNTELNISRSKQKSFDNSFSDFLRLRYKRK